eukprot:1780561-Prymnesium_polylepis.1
MLVGHVVRSEWVAPMISLKPSGERMTHTLRGSSLEPATACQDPSLRTPRIKSGSSHRPRPQSHTPDHL